MFIKEVLNLLDGCCIYEATYKGDWDYRNYVHIKDDKLEFSQNRNGCSGSIPDNIPIPESIKTALKKLEAIEDD